MAVVGQRPNRPTLQASKPHGRHASPSKLNKIFGKAQLGPAVSTLAIMLIIAGAWLVRAIGITVNYDIFIDEVTYSQVANNLATGHGLTLYGIPFDLHPPAGLALYALAIKTFALHGKIVTILFGLRPLVAFIGSLTCAVAAGLVGSIAGWRAAAVVAVVAALDPFEIFFDSRVMLETPAQLATVLSIFLLIISLRAQSEKRSWSLVVLSGISAGAAMCTKEDFGIVVSLTLFCCLVTGWITPRVKAAAALALACCCYALSESSVIISTGFQPWWRESTAGFSRLIGSKQISGFNSSTVHVSLLSRVAANMGHFGITYMILGLGALAGAYQVIEVTRHRMAWTNTADPADRGRLLVGIWSVMAAVYLGYATLFGTLEEQMYYVLFVPALCAFTLMAKCALPRMAPHWRKFAVAALAGIIIVDSAVWMSVHRRPDDEYRQLLAWAPKHLPQGSTVSVTEYTAQFILPGAVLGQWATISALIKHHVDYVLLSTTLVNEGYGLGTPQFERYLQTHAIVVFRATGTSEGALILYNVRAISGARP